MILFNFFLFFSAVILTNGHPSSRIYGGNDVENRKYPFIVSLQFDEEHLCTGVIYNNRFVLATASCMQSQQIKPESLKIVTGSNSLSTPGKKYKVISSVFNSYDNYFRQYDIALLKSAQDIEFDDNVKPAIIASKDYNQDRYPVTLAGWGYKSIDGPNSDKLQEVNLEILDRDICKKNFWISHDQICTMPSVNGGPCYNDGGSPLIDGDVLIGILSYGSPCSSKNANVYTVISQFDDWINTNIIKLMKN